MFTLQILFWFFVILFLHTWFFYVGVLYVLRKIRGKVNEKINSDYETTVTVIIAAHNEESAIAKRIRNLQELDYPQDLLEILVASDGSTDQTNEIVNKASFENNQVVLIPFQEQNGRAFVHNKSVEAAKGEIIIFTDAETEFSSDFLKMIMPHFSDSKVGAVSGRLHYCNLQSSSITQSAGVYWKYEELLRELESDLGVLAFGSGAALAVRKEIYKPIKLSSDIDCAVTLDVCLDGYLVKYETRAKAYDQIEDDSRRTFATRIRKTSLAFEDILSKLCKINPFKNILLFNSIFFHKTSRHLTPCYMILIMTINMFLVRTAEIYKVVFLIQVLFYIGAFVGAVLQFKNMSFALFSIPYNFVILNIARFFGVAKSVFGKKTISYN